LIRAAGAGNLFGIVAVPSKVYFVDDTDTPNVLEWTGDFVTSL